MRVFLPADIVAELESAIAASSTDRCVRMLWRTTDLLVAGRDRLREHEIGILDEVLVRLAEHIGPNALAQLAAALVELKMAPAETVRRLVLHIDPVVAGPLLQRWLAISSTDLKTVAATRGEQHQLAIAGRPSIEQSLTDVLLERGSKQVCRALVENPGARFSERGYGMLVLKAAHDGEMTKTLALRPDTPEAIVRTIIAHTPQATKDPARGAAPAVSERQIGSSATPPAQVSGGKLARAEDYSEARSAVIALNRIGKLNDSTVNRFAIRGETANLIASLSVLSDAPIDVIERILADPDCEALVMACRASRLSWQSTLTILSNRGPNRLSYDERERAQQLYESLYLSTSQWAVRWGDIAASAGRTAADKTVAKTGGSR